MKLTYQALVNDPNLMAGIMAQAHHERAKAVYELIILPIKHLFTARARPTAHAARPYLARQG